MDTLFVEIFAWFWGILANSIKLNFNNILAPDINIRNISTLGIFIATGIIGSLIMAFVFRYSIRGILGYIATLFIGIAGSVAGSFLFMSNIYNMIPTERGLFTFDNTLDLDFLNGLVIGGFVGSMFFAFIFGLIWYLLINLLPGKESA